MQALLGHAHVDSTAGYIHLAPAQVRAAYDAARDAASSCPDWSAPSADARRRRRGAADLVADYQRWLAGDGRGSPLLPSTRPGRSWAAGPTRPRLAAEPLTTPAAADGRAAAVPDVPDAAPGGCGPATTTWPHRKLGGLLARGRAQPARRDLARFTAAATELGYSEPRRQARRRTGRGAAADPDRAPARRADHGRPGRADRGVPRLRRREGQRQQLGQLPRPGRRRAPGAVPPRRPRPGHRPIRGAVPGLGGHYSGVAEPLRAAAARLLRAGAATRAPATVKAIASHLAGFGRFLPACDPPVIDLAALDRRATSSPTWPRWPPPGTRDGRRACRSGTGAGGSSPSASSSPTSPSGAGPPPRPAADLRPGHPRLPRTRCPATCPPDADRRLTDALEQRSASGPSPLARLHADALLLTAPPGCASANCSTSNWTACTRSPAHGAWLKVPLGKLDTERMVPLDDETLDVARPDRRPPHPRPAAAAPAHRPAGRVPAHPPRTPGLRAGAARRARPRRRRPPASARSPRTNCGTPTPPPWSTPGCRCRR